MGQKNQKKFGMSFKFGRCYRFVSPFVLSPSLPRANLEAVAASMVGMECEIGALNRLQLKLLTL